MLCNSRQPKRAQRRRSGFTLVELMVVVVILGMLAATAHFAVRGYLLNAKQNAAKLDISKIAQALDTFYVVNDRYPSNDEGLEILAQPSEKFPEGILTRLPRDPWQNPYQYNSPGRGQPYEVVCYGADGREGGEGGDKDLPSWEQ